MNKYMVRINCACFEDIEVEAKNKEEAIELAKLEFNCNGDSPEFGEILSINKGE